MFYPDKMEVLIMKARLIALAATAIALFQVAGANFKW
jgi:hypothetical protein